MHRFFVPPEWIDGNAVTILGPQAHQIARVLRMRSGDSIVVLDNSGWEIEVELTSVSAQAIKGGVQRRRLAQGEPRTKISLYQGVLKSKRFEFILEKCVELGVVEIIPVIAERCVISDVEAVERKRSRWEMIIQEAAEQCRRGRKPALRLTSFFPKACEQAKNSNKLSLIPWEKESELSLRDVLRTPPPGVERGWPPFAINLFVGPEGGFAPEEITVAQSYGLVPISLGPRVLRAETAGLVASAAIAYELGDLG